jgi:hypothetical protein
MRLRLYMTDDFDKLVLRCAGKDQKSLENHTIFNASIDHAVILFKNLLKVAARDSQPVRIFSGCFDPIVYDRLLDDLQKVREANVPIALISECNEENLATNRFVNEVRNYQHSEVRALGDQLGLPHFIVVGDRSYRIETDDALKSARANFNDPSVGATLNTIFNNLVELEHTPVETA